jgi:hypothetical protein
MSAFTLTTWQVARVRHVCHYCGDYIVPGTRYGRWRWFDRECTGVVKVHAICDERWVDVLDHAFIGEGDGLEHDEWLSAIVSTLEALGVWIRKNKAALAAGGE